MPREALNESQRQMLDKAILKDVINKEITKPTNTLPKDVDPNDPKVFKPIASPRASYNVLDNALKQAYGVNPNTNALNAPASMIDKLKGGLNQMVN